MANRALVTLTYSAPGLSGLTPGATVIFTNFDLVTRRFGGLYLW
jgi:hypothetical protein